jgi:colanic acid/amylovoran biosynthesis glycosyltransferase
MRIAFIVGHFPQLSETFILNQLTGLIARGYEVDIYGLKPEKLTKVHPDVERYSLLQNTFYQPTIPKNQILRFLKAIWLFFTNFKKAPVTLLRSLDFIKYGREAASLRLLYAVIPFLGSKPYDIIHCQFGLHGLEGMTYRDMGAIQGKLITCFRGYDISSFIQKEGENVYEKLFEKGEFFLTNCEFFRRRAIKLGCNPRQIIVHGSGIDISRFKYSDRQPVAGGKIRIVTTGRLVEKKGIEYAIKGVAQVIDKYPNVEYNIIGDGVLREKLQQLINELEVGDKIKLIGWKNQREIIEYLDNSHLFIAPSVTAKDGNQDAPVNTLKEAMAMGLPVIGTLHGGIPELIEDGISGFLVPERDSDSITEKLAYLMEHPEIWQSMGKAGRTYVEKHYEIEQLNNELVEIYQQVRLNNLQPASNGVLLPTT